MLVSVTLNPSVDHTLFVDSIKVGDTNRVEKVERDAGGKGVNLARVYAELGGDVTATGFLGGGPGSYVRSVLTLQGVKHDFVEIDGETRVNFSVESADHSRPTTFNERGPSIAGEDWQRFLSLLDDLLQGASWMSIGGSMPPGLGPEAVRPLMDIADRRGCRIALDADGEVLKHGLACSPTFVKPNDREASRLLGVDIEGTTDAVNAARAIRSRMGREDAFVVLSRGELGAILCSNDACFEGTPPKIQSVSTIGSGDSLVAGILWALKSSKPLEQAFAWGIAAGTATAMTNGAAIACRHDIERLLPEVQIVEIRG